MLSSARQIAARRNAGREKMPRFRDEVAKLLGRSAQSVETASLEESDRVFELFGTLRTRAERECELPGRMCLQTASRSAFDQQLATLQHELADVSVLLFRPQSTWCGAVISTVSEVLSRAQVLVGGVDDDLLVCSADGEVGLFAACMEDGGTNVYRIVAWSGSQGV